MPPASRTGIFAGKIMNLIDNQAKREYSVRPR